MEAAARQLEQLKRDAEKQGQQRPDLADAAKRLQDSLPEGSRVITGDNPP